MRSRVIALFVGAVLACGCGGDEAPEETPECDAKCLDETAVLGLRETVKLVYNLTLQGQPVGEQDATTPCPAGGQARVFGTATANAEQGATDVSLTYELGACGYLRQDEDADESYDLVLTGTFRQDGVLAVQPNETTALVMTSDAMSLEGTVYDPPIEYREVDCVVELGQDGDLLSGTLCGRRVGKEL